MISRCLNTKWISSIGSVCNIVVKFLDSNTVKMTFFNGKTVWEMHLGANATNIHIYNLFVYRDTYFELK